MIECGVHDLFLHFDSALKSIYSSCFGTEGPVTVISRVKNMFVLNFVSKVLHAHEFASISHLQIFLNDG